MEGFAYAGGRRVLLTRIDERLHGTCLTANGWTLAQNLERAEVVDEELARRRAAQLPPARTSGPADRFDPVPERAAGRGTRPIGQAPRVTRASGPLRHPAPWRIGPYPLG